MEGRRHTRLSAFPMHLLHLLCCFALLACTAPASARFLSTDPVPAGTSTTAPFARYAYADGNPYRHVDPDGRQSVAWVAAHSQVPPTGRAVAVLDASQRGAFDGAHVVATILLWHPGGAASPAMLVRGVHSEMRILRLLGELKNTRPVITPLGRTIPDFENDTHVGEIKDARRVTMRPQLRMQIEHARRTGRSHVLVTGTRTQVSRTVEAATTVVRRDDLGPPP
jgi:hypothetical protein